MGSNQNKSFLMKSKPLMLKDYLRDDLSSCSSSGFKSFPRRQCCTTVRFLLEIDLKTNHSSTSTTNTKQMIKRKRSRATACTTISALQRASEAVINAVKLLPFQSSTSKLLSFSPSSSSMTPVHNRTRKLTFLRRSLSKKLFKKKSLRCSKPDNNEHKEETDIRRWRPFREFLEEQDHHNPTPTPLSDQHLAVVTVSTSCSSSDSNSNSNSWTESELTVHSGSSEITSNNRNGVVENKSEKVSLGEGVTVGEDSITYSVGNNNKEWPSEEKEQFSPVSVLDYPFDDEEDMMISSPYSGIEATKQKLMQKIRRFESLAQLQPLDLEKRIAFADSDDGPPQSPHQSCSTSTQNTDKVKEENQKQKYAQELLKVVKDMLPSSNSPLSSKTDCLLLDFLREKIDEKNASTDMAVVGHEEFEQELRVLQDWINGHPQQLYSGWEVKDCSHVYIIKDMDQVKGRWSNLDEEKEEVALELEDQVFTALVNEILLDIC